MHAGILPACVFSAAAFYAGKSAFSFSFSVAVLVEDDTNDLLIVALGTCISLSLILGNGIEALLVNVDAVAEPWSLLLECILYPRTVSLDRVLRCPF